MCLPTPFHFNGTLSKAGVPVDLQWVDGRGLNALVPPEGWPQVQALLANSGLVVTDHNVQETLEAEKTQRARYPFSKGMPQVRLLHP